MPDRVDNRKLELSAQERLRGLAFKLGRSTSTASPPSFLPPSPRGHLQISHRSFGILDGSIPFPTPPFIYSQPRRLPFPVVSSRRTSSPSSYSTFSLQTSMHGHSSPPIILSSLPTHRKLNRRGAQTSKGAETREPTNDNRNPKRDETRGRDSLDQLTSLDVRDEKGGGPV